MKPQEFYSVYSEILPFQLLKQTILKKVINYYYFVFLDMLKLSLEIKKRKIIRFHCIRIIFHNLV